MIELIVFQIVIDSITHDRRKSSSIIMQSLFYFSSLNMQAVFDCGLVVDDWITDNEYQLMLETNNLNLSNNINVGDGCCRPSFCKEGVANIG